MDIFRLESVSQIINAPVEKVDFNTWIQQKEIVPFLEREIEDDNVIIYACAPAGGSQPGSW